MTFLGLDIGYDRCGVSVIQGDTRNNKIIFTGLIVTNKKDPIEKRLRTLRSDLLEIKKQFKPEGMAIEKLFFNRKNSIFEKICMSKGVAVEVFSDQPVIEVEPKKAKKLIIGDGNADKKQVQFFLSKIYDLNFDNMPDDAYDAIYLALYGMQVIELQKLYNK